MPARFRLIASSSKLSSRAGSRASQGFVQSRGVPGYSTRSGPTTSRPPGNDGLANFQITEQSPQGPLVRAAQRAEYIAVY